MPAPENCFASPGPWVVPPPAWPCWLPDWIPLHYLREKHLAPGCRLDVSPAIAPVARAMIDISDGLAAEVNHICDQSGTGAEIIVADIPIDPAVRDAARLTGNDPIEFALSGGEDFELLFSISPENKRLLEEKGFRLRRSDGSPKRHRTASSRSPTGGDAPFPADTTISPEHHD